MTKILFLFFFLISFLYSYKLEFIQIKQINLKTKNTFYIIKAKKYVKNFHKGDFFKFLLNREAYNLKNNFYQDGFLQTKQSRLYFKKAYKLGKKIYLLSVKGNFKNIILKANKVIINNKNYHFIKCELVYPNKILRRKNFYIKEE